MEQDKKTEIVTEAIGDALIKIKAEYGNEIVYSLNADFLNGKIIVRVEA